MCDEWRESFESFANWSYANGYRDDLSIDRIDNNGNYTPDNCRWADSYSQANNKRNNRFISYQGKTQTLANWCKEKNMSYNVVWFRLSQGWTFEDAISKKVTRKGKHNG